MTVVEIIRCVVGVALFLSTTLITPQSLLLPPFLLYMLPCTPTRSPETEC